MYLKILKMGPMALFTDLKIILLQCFQFSVLAKISSIQMDPKSQFFFQGGESPMVTTQQLLNLL